MNLPYHDFAQAFREMYGEKVYKIPIKRPLTCPNRDGTKGRGGCIFCGEEGGSFENLSSCLSVKEQRKRNEAFVRKRFGAKKFITYFQNFTNTYQDIDAFKRDFSEAIGEDTVGVTISTRPDVLYPSHLDCAASYCKDYLITFELGVQSINPRTLDILGRGHGLSEIVDGVMRLKSQGFRVCAHMILDLPWDTQRDIIESAKLLGTLGVDEVKIHSLYVVKGTRLAREYMAGRFRPLAKEDFLTRTMLFLGHLPKDIVIGRILGRAPEEDTLFCNWNTSWWKLRDQLIEKMAKEQITQGSLRSSE